MPIQDTESLTVSEKNSVRNLLEERIAFLEISLRDTNAMLVTWDQGFYVRATVLGWLNGLSAGGAARSASLRALIAVLTLPPV